MVDNVVPPLGHWQKFDPAFTRVPIHAALLNNGLVIGFGGSGNDPTKADDPKITELFDPSTGLTRVVPQKLDSDLFCCGTAVLPDGRLLAAGGTAHYDSWPLKGTPLPPFRGLKESWIFDAATSEWTRATNMAGGRWYPTLITLADGRVVSVAGLMRWFPWFFRRRVEAFDASGQWKTIRKAGRWMPMYPHLHLLPDGDVFFDGCYNTHYPWMYRIIGFAAGRLRIATGKWEHDPQGNEARREEGASVMLALRPPDYHARILLIGGTRVGELVAHKECRAVDFATNPPQWREVAPLNIARYYSYAALLPDGKVFVLGGKRGAVGHHGDPLVMGPMHPGGEVPMDPFDHLAILETEMYDPVANTWTLMAPMTLGRNYHSSALLLPDGRVIALGGNRNSARGDEQLAVEVYSPPYLNDPDRPTIEAAPASIVVGTPFEVRSPEAADVDQVVLLRPGSTTHCVNTDQRLVEATILEKAGSVVRAVVARVPERPAVAPPGHYMVFLLAGGTPSVGKFTVVSRA